MQKKIFIIFFGLIIIAALRFYYIECKRGFDQSPVLTNKERTVKIVPQAD